jgi:hypothetical protein
VFTHKYLDGKALGLLALPVLSSVPEALESRRVASKLVDGEALPLRLNSRAVCLVKRGGAGKWSRFMTLYAARIENLGPGDFVKIDCAACSHTALLTSAFLARLGFSGRERRCSTSKGECAAEAAGGEAALSYRSNGGRT